ncbi:MAG TPA: hypothetical protein PKA90_12165 [Ignavibacteria bacterium]|nr:hypothetical protein [Ignavibacteria bacterium]HMR41175.1 hypothetical protein [Ignavibacteria bacterium]
MSLKNKAFSYFLIIAICFSLSSCIGVDRQIRLNKDGSGEETMKITFMKEFYGLMSSMSAMMDSARQESFLDSLYNDQIFIDKTKNGYDSIQGVKIIDISSQRNEDSSSTFTIKYSFDNLDILGSSLQKTLEDENDNQDKIPTVVTMMPEGDNVVFRYDYENPEEDTEIDSTEIAMKNSMMKIFENGYINFEIEFPYEVISSNSTSANGNILKWDYPMKDIFMDSKLNLEAVMKK